jgi:hypothetical protein
LTTGSKAAHRVRAAPSMGDATGQLSKMRFSTYQAMEGLASFDMPMQWQPSRQPTSLVRLQSATGYEKEFCSTDHLRPLLALDNRSKADAHMVITRPLTTSEKTPAARGSQGRARGRRLLTASGLLLAGFLIGVTASVTPSASASYTQCGARFYAHVSDSRGGCTFPYNGFRWIQLNPRISLYRTTDRCKQPQIRDSRENFNDQLAGSAGGRTDDFAYEWTHGMDMLQHPTDADGNCVTTGDIDEFTDIHLDWKTFSQWYNDLGRGNYGGVTTSTLGTTNWCDIWGANHPCGIHTSRIELNEYRFDNVYSAAYGTKVLIHESGHSMGFNDYCGGGMSNYESISKDDASCSFSSGYTNLDRARLYDLIYKNR